jgi:hypothetical protein
VWQANEAVTVAGMGTIHASGAPFLMQSATVQLACPPTGWAQWQVDELSGTSLDGPADDADGDGTKNLMEYVFGLPPRLAGPPPVTPVGIVGGCLQLTVPRRADHPSAVLVVEVSSDLVNWYSGPGHTVEVSNTPAAWVVRDALAAPSPGKRFMRVRAALP